MKIGKVGPRQRVPTAAELRSILDQPFNPSLFGSTIQEIMLRELEEDPNAMAPRGIQGPRVACRAECGVVVWLVGCCKG